PPVRRSAPGGFGADGGHAPTSRQAMDRRGERHVGCGRRAEGSADEAPDRPASGADRTAAAQVYSAVRSVTRGGRCLIDKKTSGCGGDAVFTASGGLHGAR